MKTKIILCFILAITVLHATAQNKSSKEEELKTFREEIDRMFKGTAPVHQWYPMSTSELIFSWGEVKSNGQTLDNIVRFTCFFHFQQQFHYNFSNGFGLYTGFGVRNVGFINEVPVDAYSTATVKQRSYSLGIPLALKLGNLPKGTFLALGAEVEWMFAYKQKVLYNDQKIKDTDWFSNEVNPINPSLFADIRFAGGAYIRFKYYLLDFLKDKNMDFIPPDYLTNTPVYYRPESSKLMYVAIGLSFYQWKHHAHKTRTTGV